MCLSAYETLEEGGLRQNWRLWLEFVFLNRSDFFTSVLVSCFNSLSFLIVDICRRKFTQLNFNKI